MTEREMARKKAARKARARKARNRRVALTICLMLVVCVVSVGGTIAWLTDNTENLTNTFTPSDINIELKETDADATDNDAGKSFKMVPGNEITKDPEVVIKAGSEPCWVFLQVNESTNLDDFITYELDNTWTLYAGNVYYTTVGTVADGPLAADEELKVLVGDKVTVNADVTKADMKALIDGTNPEPTLSFKAAAVQLANLSTVADAYDTIPSDFWA